MNVRGFIEDYRTLSQDKKNPPIFADADVIRRLNQAEREAVRRTRMLVDSTTANLAVLGIGAGDSVLDIDPRVMFIRRVKLASQDLPLPKIHRNDLDCVFPGWETTTAGTPVAWCHNYETGKILLVPGSDIDDTVNLTVVRDPLTEMKALDDEPEVPLRCHDAMTHWIVWAARLIHDADLYNPDLARDHLAQFEAEFGKRSSTRDEVWIASELGYDEDGANG